MKNEYIVVVMQAFYGNRTCTELSEDTIDCMLQGMTDNAFRLDYEVDRTVIAIPDSKCVLVYNKHQEAAALKRNEEWKQTEDYIAKPLASIPEMGVEIYSRCFLCRMSDDGMFESIQNEDAGLISKYLAM